MNSNHSEHLAPAAFETASASETALPSAVRSARSAVAVQLRANDEDIEVRSWERVNWSDECLDLPLEDSFACTAAVIPGYRILFEVQGEGTYEYHTDIDGSILLRSIPLQA